MHRNIIRTVLIAALLLSSSVCLAAEGKSAAPAEATGKAKTSERNVQGKDAKTAPVKLVDINSAAKAELKKLPGIGDAEADKIIAGRPYLSKADLVTRNIVPRGVYENLKRQVIAKPKPQARAK